MNKAKSAPEEQIYNLIKDKIIKKELFPKSQVVELQLAEETGISRTPIRQALKRLSYDGLIDIIPNRGAFVTSPTLEEIISVYECKKVLEAAAIEKACINITDDELYRLEELLNQGIQTHKTKDLYSFILLNEKFHMIIAKASKNKYYEKYIKELIEKNNVYLIFYDRFMLTAADESAAIKEHFKILDALKSKDIEACVEASIRHNQITLDQLSLNGIV